MPTDLANWWLEGKICTETNPEITDEGEFETAAAVTWTGPDGNFAGINIHWEGSSPNFANTLMTLIHEWMHAEGDLSDDLGEAAAATGQFLCDNADCLDLGLGPMMQHFKNINDEIQSGGGTDCVACPAAGVDCAAVCPEGMNCPEQDAGGAPATPPSDSLGRPLAGQTIFTVEKFPGYFVWMNSAPKSPGFGSLLRVRVEDLANANQSLAYYLPTPFGISEIVSALLSFSDHEALVVTRDLSANVTRFYIWEAGDIQSSADDLLVPLPIDFGVPDVGTIIHGRRMPPNAVTDVDLLGLMSDSGVWLVDTSTLDTTLFATPRNLAGYAQTFTLEMFVTYGNPNIPPISGQGDGFSFEGQPEQDWSLSVGISERKPSLYPVYDMRDPLFSIVDLDGDLMGDVAVLYPAR